MDTKQQLLQKHCHLGNYHDNSCPAGNNPFVNMEMFKSTETLQQLLSNLLQEVQTVNTLVGKLVSDMPAKLSPLGGTIGSFHWQNCCRICWHRGSTHQVQLEGDNLEGWPSLSDLDTLLEGFQLLWNVTIPNIQYYYLVLVLVTQCQLVFHRQHFSQGGLQSTTVIHHLWNI